MFTLVLWLVCLAVGALGFLLCYERPHAPEPSEPPILAQPLQVELTQDLIPPRDAEPAAADPLAPPPPPNALTPPPIVRPIAVAQPSPAIAFPLPVEEPTRIVGAKSADYDVSPTNATALTAVGPPAAQPLTFGQDEGKQPAPDYPAAARRQAQEGTVLVRLTVGENGRVLSADAVLPSPWPLLNLKDARISRFSESQCPYLLDESAFRARANNLTFCEVIGASRESPFWN